MKKILSVTKLNLAVTWKWVLLILLASLGIEGGLIYRSLTEAIASQYGTVLVTGASGLFHGNGIRLVYMFGMILMVPMTSAFWQNGKSRMGYTMTRLGMSQFRIGLGHLIYSVGILLVYWASHLVMITGVLHYYIQRMAAMGVLGMNDQALLGAFWSNSFLHSLLPVGDPLGLLRTILVILALAATGTTLMVREFYGRNFGMAGYFVIVYCINEFSKPDPFLTADIVIFALVLIISLVSLWRKPEQDLYPAKGPDKAELEPWEYDYLMGDEEPVPAAEEEATYDDV